MSTIKTESKLRTIKALLGYFFGYTRVNIFNIETYSRSTIEEKRFDGLAIGNINEIEENSTNSKSYNVFFFFQRRHLHDYNQ